MADLETKSPERRIKDKKKAEERVCEETYGENGIKKRIEGIRLQGLAYGLTKDEAALRSRWLCCNDSEDRVRVRAVPERVAIGQRARPKSRSM